MNKEEIKQQYSMRDITERYGLIPNRAGFIKCPFHTGDHTASMKIYKDSFNCFGCGANGDIFTFVMMMDNLSFREAFEYLGGTYEKLTTESKKKLYEIQKAREQKRKEEEKHKEKIRDNSKMISMCRELLSTLDWDSQEYADCYNYLQYLLYIHGELCGLPY